MGRMGTTAWTRDNLAVLAEDGGDHAPVIRRADRLVDGIDLWDMWPLRRRDGTLAAFDGSSLWAALSAPAQGDPGLRHDVARIRLLSHRSGKWSDHGHLFEDEASAGSREWAGCAVVEDGRVWVAYTAAGSRYEAIATFRQRIFATGTQLVWKDDAPQLEEWSPHTELIGADGTRYQRADETEGEPGFIKAFRDPFRFTGPTDDEDHLLFTGSQAGSNTDFNGVIGIARASDDEPGGWELADPLITADGVNNELERPHLVVVQGNLYLFFSTQARTFHPDVTGPTGLYGFVASSLAGPFTPLNGSGLVFSNPPEEPFQAYSWLVLNDLSVVSFVDFYRLGGRHPDELAADGAALRGHFGGTMAPVLKIGVDGDRAWLEGEVDVPRPV